MNDYIILYSNIIPVRGISRSLLCDTQRGILRLIPNALYDLFDKFNTTKYKVLALHYGEANKEIVLEYFSFLIENEFAFFCSQKEIGKFPPIKINNFDIPYPITTGILELGETNIENIYKIISEFEYIKCHSLEIRILSTMSIDALDAFLDKFTNSQIKELNIHISDYDYEIDSLKILFRKHYRLTKLLIGNSKQSGRYSNFYTSKSLILFTHKDINNPMFCGNFAFNTFHNNLSFISEAQDHNVCLNRKISVDRFGKIKNCPSMSSEYGNINIISLSEIVKKQNFTEFWNIKKR